MISILVHSRPLRPGNSSRVFSTIRIIDGYDVFVENPFLIVFPPIHSYDTCVPIPARRVHEEGIGHIAVPILHERPFQPAHPMLGKHLVTHLVVVCLQLAKHFL